MSVYDTQIGALDGSDLDLKALQGKAALFVNVASKCGLTPQYEQLEQIHERYAEEGFTVVGFPCNQFGGQEPGTEAEILELIKTNWDRMSVAAVGSFSHGSNNTPSVMAVSVAAAALAALWSEERPLNRRLAIVLREPMALAPASPISGPRSWPCWNHGSAKGPRTRAAVT